MYCMYCIYVLHVLHCIALYTWTFLTPLLHHYHHQWWSASTTNMIKDRGRKNKPTTKNGLIVFIPFHRLVHYSLVAARPLYPWLHPLILTHYLLTPIMKLWNLQCHICCKLWEKDNLMSCFTCEFIFIPWRKKCINTHPTSVKRQSDYLKRQRHH